jgi:hypothetical protein
VWCSLPHRLLWKSKCLKASTSCSLFSCDFLCHVPIPPTNLCMFKETTINVIKIIKLKTHTFFFDNEFLVNGVVRHLIGR